MLGTAASCIIRDGEMKLAKLVVKIVDSEKEIVAKSAELSLLTSQKNSIMLSLPTSDGSSSVETFGGLLDLDYSYFSLFFKWATLLGCNMHLMCYYMFWNSLVIKTYSSFLSM